MLSSQEQLLGITHHGLIAPYLRQHFPAGGINLSDIIENLGDYGQPMLADRGTEQPHRRYWCVLTTDWSDPLSADGSTPMLAALRCLMETLSEMNRMSEHGLAGFDSLLSDC